MKHTIKFLSLALLIGVVSCSAPKDELADKKDQLQSYKSEAAALKVSIQELEDEIARLDPEFRKNQRKSILITTIQPEQGDFEHYVEVTGSVLSKKNVNISAELSGRIEEIVTREGMAVRKGQVIATIDSESVQRSLDEIQTQLDLAKTIFEKQERLWNQQIGTEIQYLEAKNRMETLEKNLASLQLQEDKSTVRAPFDGTVEEMLVRVGELVQPGTPIVNMIGEDDLFIEGDISERYIGILQQGDSVDIRFPSIDRSLKTKVTAIGSVINPDNRTFKVEVFLPKMDLVKPNMLSVLNIQDYENSEAVIVPTYLILQDNQGSYMFVVEEGLARKRYVERGMTYEGKTEILEGLDGSETLVDKGFREVGDNFNVNIAS
ncbi:efflux RND transporter periplasmic adaptor subunit [Cyclobacterium jeungdonense]|uniref:Efflux RND transporter periplasmic adaptor subunit n=1 Tax=Cyclobacterium jeungdonense TaxID=708087 RepID=A0ABT8C6J0_9BACT|nr:efflux RND transporter periplasmic adaptor subunit [Cyclobacterium jeungdonense]MDN3687316.1 efflux RND transporter periplasmic adaptor subunit [Cyclobacterium jeungdonense]